MHLVPNDISFVELRSKFQSLSAVILCVEVLVFNVMGFPGFLTGFQYEEVLASMTIFLWVFQVLLQSEESQERQPCFIIVSHVTIYLIFSGLAILFRNSPRTRKPGESMNDWTLHSHYQIKNADGTSSCSDVITKSYKGSTKRCGKIGRAHV